MTVDPRVAGIDWAAQPRDRALVGLRFDRSRRSASVDVVSTRVDDSAVVEAVRGGSYSTIAVDIPFGWPSRFADFARAWSCSEPCSDFPVPDYEAFAFRRTDVLVTKIKRPLSVSSDRIALATLTWLRLVAAHELHANIDVHSERPALRPSLIEVYPAATLATLVKSDALTIKNYKKDPAVRAALIDRLTTIFRIDPLSEDLRRELVGKGEVSHATDAFVAALTGLMYEGALGRDLRRPTTDDEKRDALREGWIFFPASGVRTTAHG